MAVRLGPTLGLLDRPDDPLLKVHRQPAVPLGGVAVVAGIVVGWSIAGDVNWVLAGLASGVVTLGLVDDRIGLSPGVRLVTEGAIGVATLAFDLVPLRLGSPLEAAVGVGLIVLAINAVNLVDGLDGLAGSVALVAFLGLAALAAIRGLSPTLALVMAGALAGFLLFNWHPARVFLGDNGAYLVGFVLAVAIMRVSPDGLGAELWVAGLVLGVFVLDLFVTVLRRRSTGSPMFSGDRQHLYDRLRDRGWSVPSVVGTASAAQSVFTAIALILAVGFVN